MKLFEKSSDLRSRLKKISNPNVGDSKMEEDEQRRDLESEAEETQADNMESERRAGTSMILNFIQESPPVPEVKKKLRIKRPVAE